MEDAFVVGARFAPEVAAPTGNGGCDKVAGGEAGEAGGVEEGGEGDRLGQVEGDGDDGDAVAGEDEGRDVARVVGGLGITEDGAVGVADVDDAVKLLAWWVMCQIDVSSARDVSWFWGGGGEG